MRGRFQFIAVFVAYLFNWILGGHSTSANILNLEIGNNLTQKEDSVKLLTRFVKCDQTQQTQITQSTWIKLWHSALKMLFTAHTDQE